MSGTILCVHDVPHLFALRLGYFANEASQSNPLRGVPTVEEHGLPRGHAIHFHVSESECTASVQLLISLVLTFASLLPCKTLASHKRLFA